MISLPEVLAIWSARASTLSPKKTFATHYNMVLRLQCIFQSHAV